MRTFWTTFYSYKGGVGRSMALSNIAALLVQKGRRVVLIDFDLEAPGLDSFSEFSAASGKRGVVEYVAEFRKNKIAPDINQFVHACELPGPLPGKLWVMPAGKKDASYNRERTALDWNELYESGLGEPFIENWKASITASFQPDYVLVDSRTGLTDVAGVCTLHLPDLVVMLFGLNDQNVRGIAAVAKTIREADHNRIPQIHYVASPVPTLPTDKRGPMIKRFESAAEALGVKVESLIRYDYQVALHEELFVLQDTPGESLITRDYKDLLTKLIGFNRNGLDFLSIQVDDIVRSGEAGRREKLYALLEREFKGRAHAVFLRSRLRLAAGCAHEAAQLAKIALALDPTHQESYEWLLSHYNSENEPEKALEICNLVVANSNRIDKIRLPDIHHKRGAVALACKDAASAIESFKYCVIEEEKDPTPASLMIAKFNLAEAKRRNGDNPPIAEWNEIVALFDQAGQTAETQLPNQANRLQAIHIACALSGDLGRAREFLIKAKHAADLLGDIEDLFSVKTYQNVSQPEFLEINKEMLAALDHGMLWDGFPISQP
jgi:MinD-like ATPase involved in chromosome partitioning or flagellar assembly